ncbi:13866_t:CDS:2, partial [Entrophospora sp. SA101]
QIGDPLSRKMINGRIHRFYLMARKGTEVDVDRIFSQRLAPHHPNQTNVMLDFYYTAKHDATYCDEPEMKELGRFYVDLPDTHLGLNRSVLLTLHFGSMEIVATAKNETNDKTYLEKLVLNSTVDGGWSLRWIDKKTSKILAGHS